MQPERPLVLIVVRSAVLAGVVLLAAVPVYVYVEPPWRSLVARLATALVLGAALVQLRSAVADWLAHREASALDEARARPVAPPAVPLRFVDLTHDVRAALWSRRHFEKVLWPRLLGLARAPVAPPPLRPGRGPSLAQLREVITRIEKQP